MLKPVSLAGNRNNLNQDQMQCRVSLVGVIDPVINRVIGSRACCGGENRQDE